jgi:phosphatidylserine decarboxylase
MYSILKFVPKSHLSHFVGSLVHMRLPRTVSHRLIRWFARTYDIDVESASKQIHEYPSIGEFFTRELKPGVRPIEGTVVSPVDGTLRSFGLVHEGRLEQVKGKTYSLHVFLGDDVLAREFEDGVFFNFYLSPQDYHHIHTPISGDVTKSVHVPGKLWPVNDWSLGAIEELFAVNERIVTYLQTDLGSVAVVMIGATNVGKMSVSYDTFITNVPPRKVKTEVHDYPKPVRLEVGAKLGTFHMGSSVVVLFRKGVIDLEKVAVTAPMKVRYGQALLK